MKTSLRTLALCGAVGFGGYVLGSSAMNAKTPDQLPAVVAQGLPGLAALLGGGVKQDLLDLEVFPSGDTAMIAWRTQRSDGRAQIQWIAVNQAGIPIGDCSAVALEDVPLSMPVNACE